MKRLLISILIGLLLISTSACSNAKDDTQTNTNTSQTNTEPKPEPTKEPEPEPTPEPAKEPETKEETKTEPAPETKEETKPKEEPKPEPTPEPAKTIEFKTEGVYEIFGVMNEGSLVKSSDLQMESTMTLKEDGTGVMTFNEDSEDVTKWELKDGVISITMADGGQANAKYHDGILELDIYGDGSMLLYYGQEGADISGYEFTTLEEVKAKANGN